jgi:hypothetical protein
MRPLTGADKGGIQTLSRSSDPAKALDRHDIVGVVLEVPDPGSVAADRDDFIVGVEIVAGPDEVAHAQFWRTSFREIDEAQGRGGSGHDETFRCSVAALQAACRQEMIVDELDPGPRNDDTGLFVEITDAARDKRSVIEPVEPIGQDTARHADQ